MTLAWTPGRRRAALLGAWLASTALLVVCARAIDWTRAADVLAAVRPGWILAAVAANAAVLPCMAAFWRTLRPREEPPVSFGRMFEIAATATSLMNTVPFGGGHASAVLLLVRRANTTARGALSVLALDQLGEGIAKVSVLFLVGLLAPLPAWMRGGVITVSIGVSALLVALAVASRWARELRTLHDWRRSTSALAFVLGTKVAEGLAIVAVQHALGVEIAPAGTLLVLSTVILATMIPVAPGNVGTYEASVFLAYRYLGVAPEAALSLALVQHVCFMLPSVGVGYSFISAQALTRSAIASR